MSTKRKPVTLAEIEAGLDLVARRIGGDPGLEGIETPVYALAETHHLA